jgi:RimJ/RimL family protein N-acetyltransferase
VGLLGDERVGFVDVEVDGERGGIAIYVRREFRGRGLGQRWLRLPLARDRAWASSNFVASVESDNVASTRCFLAAGFSRARVDEFGLVFRLRVADA